MTFVGFAKLYALTVPIFFAIDLLWLGIVARGFYRAQLGSLMRAEVRWGAALAFYLLFIAGILVFAVLPGLERQSLARAVVLGGFFGLVAYATYDLTNLATLEGFPGTMVIVDLGWGTVLCGLVAGAAFKLGQWAWVAS